MMSESLAIVAVIVVMAAMYKRAGKGLIAAMALPLICVPLGRLISVVVLGTSGIGTLPSYIFVVVGLMASVALCTAISMKLSSKKARVIYLAVSFIFSGALLIAYLI